MEATMFTVDLRPSQAPHAAALKVAHPLICGPSPPRRKERSYRRQQDLRLLACDFCRSAIWLRRRFVNGGARCAIVTCWCPDVQMKIKISSLLDGSRGEL